MGSYPSSQVQPAINPSRASPAHPDVVRGTLGASLLPNTMMIFVPSPPFYYDNLKKMDLIIFAFWAPRTILGP